ncbi:MAG: SDR family oxidoreductase [Acidobacteria bacterium]|nr:SDR family oxidoreductase [Acidobacteriota bacterium]
MSGRFEGKTAIVSGGSMGIGLAVVEELCREGARVAFSGIEKDAGAETEKNLLQAGYEVRFFHGDMASEEFCHNLVAGTVAQWGSLHFLVNNAFSFTAKWADASREDWHRVMDVGPIAYATVASAATEAMRSSGGGAIVNVSSISAFIAQPKRWTYNAAKGAVHTLTKCMALDFAPLGIRVNSVSPGWIWTREVLKAAGGDREKWDPVWGQFHMMERCGDVVEVAAAVLFLLSDDASFITAVDLPVDGGYQGLGSEGLGKVSQFAGSK